LPIVSGSWSFANALWLREKSGGRICAAQDRLQPPLWGSSEQRVFRLVERVRPAAAEQLRDSLAEVGAVLWSKRRLACCDADCDLDNLREAVARKGNSRACELKAVEEESKLGRAAQALFDASSFVGGDERQHAFYR
jgi:hypothetical protein